MRIVLRLLILAPFLTACSGGIKSKVFSSAPLPSLSLCKTSNVSNPKYFESQKIYPDDFFPQYSTASFNKATPQILPTGLSVTILMNNSCFQTHGLENLDVTIENKKPLIKDISHSDIDSYTAILNRDYELSELMFELDFEECVVGLSQNIEFKPTAIPNDPSFGRQRYLNAIRFDSAYDTFFTPSTGIQNDIVIAIVDTGVDIDHPDLRTSVWVNSTEAMGRVGIDDDQNGYIDDVNGYDFASDVANPRPKTASNDHGTHVAGLAAATGSNGTGISGVLSNHARIMALNVFGANNAAVTADIDRAIRYAVDNGAKVINLSLGGPGQTSSTASAISYAIQRGATVIAASGNDGEVITGTNFFSPAGYAPQLQGLISVGATNASNPNALCSFSNRSPAYVELSAPGCDSQSLAGLYSTLPGGQYGSMEGTSMAAPIVSGAASIAIQFVEDHSNLSVSPALAEQILTLSASTSTNLTSSIQSGRQLDLLGISNYILTQNLVNPPPTCP